MVTFLGMGLLGSNFVRALINKGEEVRVWNRTASKAAALEQYGAKPFENIVDAVKGAGIVHLTLKDDATVDSVLSMAAPGLQPGVAIIDHTTTSMPGAIQRTAQWKERGITYLHAPVFMGPKEALEGKGFMLVSGDQDVVSRYTPVLSGMTGKLLNFGGETGRAAAMKLVGNNFLVCLNAGLADTLSLARALQVPVSDMSTLFENWNPGNSLLFRMGKMSGGDYSQPSWELDMARKDTGLFMSAAEQAGIQLSVIPAIARLMDHWIGKGHGEEDWTVIGSAPVNE
ncbi:MAG: NAD(P)-dependent oxidoreductase [Bacteroidetes bacterium]|nr:NAD(P)-dependent oxidoreductase [Bacteroidota bacterium]